MSASVLAGAVWSDLALPVTEALDMSALFPVEATQKGETA